jgi:hypothetical protein
MVIKKENLGTILEFNGTSFLLDPKEFRAKENYTIISSKLIKEKNFDKIFIVSRALPDARDGLKTCAKKNFICDERIRALGKGEI